KRQREAVLPGDLRQGIRPNRRVRLHDKTLLGGQLARLANDVIGQADVTNVVQWSATFEHLDEVFIDLAGEMRNLDGFPRDSSTIALQALQVGPGFEVALFN